MFHWQKCSLIIRLKSSANVQTFFDMAKKYFHILQKVSIFATDNSIAMDKKDNVEKPRIHWTLALIPLAVLVAL